MSTSWPSKDPDEKLDYRLNWTKPLDGDLVANSAWTLSANTGLTITANSFSNTETVVWLANGHVNKTHYITNTIHTDGGRIFTLTVSLQVFQR